jgi:carbonic anhydrase
MPVQQLVAGVHHFRSQVFKEQRELFERLGSGQTPDTLFITCSDSRVDPNLITQTVPGQMFILRNAGNILPPYGASNGGETAAVEFAIRALDVKDIIICGHSQCGAMKGLLNPELLAELPDTTKWLKFAETTRQIVRSKYQHLRGDELLSVTIEENVLSQIENLQTHPAVAVGLMRGTLKLHAWHYEIETGEIYAYDIESGQFRPLGMIKDFKNFAHPAPPVLAEKRLSSGEVQS